jgi:hypothetical protein
MNTTAFAICAKCRHYRTRPNPKLFNQSDLQTPGILKAQLEWDQQQDQRANEERRRFEAGQEFVYEPFNYAWCAAYTHLGNLDASQIEGALKSGKRGQLHEVVEQSIEHDEERMRRAKAGDEVALQELAENGRAKMNPVTGEVMQVYELCVGKNPDGQCPLFEAK